MKHFSIEKNQNKHQNEAERTSDMHLPQLGESKNRKMNPDTVFFIRLWYLGHYCGQKAIRPLTVSQIAKVLGRSEENVRLALQFREEPKK